MLTINSVIIIDDDDDDDEDDSGDERIRISKNTQNVL